MRLEDVQIDCISVAKDRRAVRHEKVKTLAKSIEQIGLLHPIGITDGYNLVYGEHRLRAVESLGKKTIACRFVGEGDEDLAEVDENLERNNLDAMEFSLAMARQKREWEKRNGVAKRGAKTQEPISDKSVANSTFAKAASEKEGVSARTVERAAAVGEALSEKAVAILAGTPVADNKTKLAAIAAMPESKQPAAAKRAVAGEALGPKPSKNGHAKGWHSDAKVESLYGQLVRLVDDRASVLELKRDSGYKRCLSNLSDFLASWNDWKKVL